MRVNLLSFIILICLGKSRINNPLRKLINIKCKEFYTPSVGGNGTNNEDTRLLQCDGQAVGMLPKITENARYKVTLDDTVSAIHISPNTLDY